MIDTNQITLQIDDSIPEALDVERCLMLLYSTRAGTVPMDREFGLSYDFVGLPLPVAQNEFALELIQKTEKYEPRVKVKEIRYEYEPENGVLIPVILLEQGEEAYE